ncbi:hypothetical protein ABK040_012723 [Willaertia magna]
MRLERSNHKNTILFYLTIIILSLYVSTCYADSCYLEGTEQSPKGSCDGPLHRARLRMAFIERFNSGCPRHLISYYKEGETEIQCGECAPGTTFNDEFSCSVNQYCDDNAKCQPIKQHPLYGAECPMELGEDQIASYCGPSLYCYNHKCLPCREGEIDYNYGAKCILGEWTFSPWIDSTYEPMPLILFSLSAATLIYSILHFSCRGVKLMTKIKSDYDEYKENSQLRELVHEFFKSLDLKDNYSNLNEKELGKEEEEIEMEENDEDDEEEESEEEE